jgi:5-methylcytosine-specific restriction endonuclease McrA
MSNQECNGCGCKHHRLIPWGLWGLCETCHEKVIKNLPPTPGERMRSGYDDSYEDDSYKSEFSY